MEGMKIFRGFTTPFRPYEYRKILGRPIKRKTEFSDTISLIQIKKNKLIRSICVEN